MYVPNYSLQHVNEKETRGTRGRALAGQLCIDALKRTSKLTLNSVFNIMKLIVKMEPFPIGLVTPGNGYVTEGKRTKMVIR